MDGVFVWLAVGTAAYWIARLVERTLFEVRFRDEAFNGIDATDKAAEDYLGEDADWIVHLLSGLGAREETIRATVTQAATTVLMATVCSMYDRAWKFSSRRRQLKPILESGNFDAIIAWSERPENISDFRCIYGDHRGHAFASILRQAPQMAKLPQMEERELLLTLKKLYASDDPERPINWIWPRRESNPEAR